MTLTQLPKPLLFGLFGVIGCALGWAAGEPVVRLIPVPRVPAAGETTLATAGPGLLVDNSAFTDPRLRQLEEQGQIKKGPVKIGLVWHNINDLDLYCVDPAGEKIFFQHRNSASGGELDRDCNYEPPLDPDAAEHIVWEDGFPAGTYRVFVHEYKNHGGTDPTGFRVEIVANGQRIEPLAGSVREGEKSAERTFTVAAAVPRATITTVAPEAGAKSKLDLKIVAVTALWTALLAIPLGLALVAGQNALFRRPLLTGRQAAVTVAGCLTAGLCAGALSQLGFALLNAVFDLQRNALLLSLGQMIGWLALGALLGLIMAFVIPNLPPAYALFGGMAGGVVGALAFLLAKQLPALGAPGGRGMGAACLGLGIGVMVALVEKLAREAALIVHWGPNERNILNLGERPIVLGSSREAHLYLPKEQGFPPVAALVTFREGRITLENKMTNTQHTLTNGHKLQLGKLILEVQSA